MMHCCLAAMRTSSSPLVQSQPTLAPLGWVLRGGLCAVWACQPAKAVLSLWFQEGRIVGGHAATSHQVMAALLVVAPATVW